MRRGWLVAVGGAAVLAAAGGLAVWLLRPAAGGPVWADEYDLSATPPEVIVPGTVVGRTGPDGWSHLVIKSLPRVRESERGRVPDNRLPDFGRDGTVRMASWMFTAFVADVVPERQGEHARHRLRAIGLGLGTRVGEHDTVVTADTAARHGAPVGWIKRQVLDTGYRVQKQAVVPVRGAAFAVLDTPVTVRCAAGNRTIRYRYALLADARSGGLDVLLWQLPGADGACGDLSRAVLLEPNCIDEAELVPDPEQFNRFGIPGETAFAVDKLPPHRLELPFPPALRGLVARTRFAPDEARALEDGLRALLAEARR